jgi:hypothetical protein
MPKLYDLSSQYNQIFYTMNEESDYDQLEETLSSIEEEFEVKAENVAKLIKSFDGDIEGFKAEEKRLAARRKSLENYQDRMKQYLESNMRATGKEKIKGNVFSLAMQNNPPKVIIHDEEAISDKYKEYEVKYDKKAMLEDLKAGVEVRGAHTEQSSSLRIR